MISLVLALLVPFCAKASPSNSVNDSTSRRNAWERGQYHRISDSLARSVGLSTAIEVTPGSKCKRTRFPTASALVWLEELRPWIGLPKDSDNEMASLESYECQHAETYIVVGSIHGQQVAQLTFLLRKDSLQLAVGRERSSWRERERLFVFRQTGSATWIRDAAALDALSPAFSPDSSKPSADSLRQSFRRLSPLPDAKQREKIRWDSTWQSVERRMNSIDNSIRSGSCVPVPIDSISELADEDRPLAKPTKSNAWYCPNNLETMVTQWRKSGTDSFEQRVYADRDGMFLLRSLATDSTRKIQERSLFRSGRKILESSTPSNAARPSGMDTATWNWLGSWCMSRIPTFPRQAISQDGFLFLEANPEPNFDAPPHEVLTWYVRDLDSHSVPSKWKPYLGKVVQAIDSTHLTDTIVGFCLVVSSPWPGGNFGDANWNNSYLAAKLGSGRGKESPPRLMGLLGLLTSSAPTSTSLDKRFDAWMNDIAEGEDQRVSDKYSDYLQSQEEAKSNGMLSEFFTPGDQCPLSWRFSNGTDEFWLYHQSNGLSTPCLPSFDGEYSLAAHYRRPPLHADPYTRSPFAPTPPRNSVSSKSAQKKLPGLEYIPHPCLEFDAFVCGIRAVSSLIPDHPLQALVEAEGEMHHLAFLEWNGTHWVNRFDLLSDSRRIRASCD